MAWGYSDRADKNGDGYVDYREQSDADYEYDAIMGTNISGAFPEHDKKPHIDEDSDDYVDMLLYGDAEDLFDDDFSDSSDFEEDEDEKAEEYSNDLSLEFITEADWDGYFTADGKFHCWEIADMFDEADEDGFWDKCGNYHEYDKEPNGYWELGEFHSYDDEEDDEDDEEIPIQLECTISFGSESACNNEETNKFTNEDLYALIYDKFPEISNYYSKKEFRKDPSLLYNIYPKNRALVLDCWDWVMQNYSELLLNDPDFEYARNIFFELIPDVLYYEDKDIKKPVFANHLLEHQDFFETLFSKLPYESENYSLFQFLAWCIIKDDLDSFKKAYNLILNNKNYDEEPAEKAHVLEKTLFYLDEFTEESAPERFYTYLKNEINSIKRKGRIPFLLEELDYEYLDVPRFHKPGENRNDDIYGFTDEEEQCESDSDEITFSDTIFGKVYSKAYEQFPEMADLITPKALEENFYDLIGAYRRNRPLVADFWAWIVENYANEKPGVGDYEFLREHYMELIPVEMFIFDAEDRNKFLQHYIAERPSLFEKLLLNRPFDLTSKIPPQFMAWAVIRNDFTSFEKVYNSLIETQNYKYNKPPTKEMIIGGVLFWRSRFAKAPSSEKFYIFFKKEIETIADPNVRDELFDLLEEKTDGVDSFVKPKSPVDAAAILSAKSEVVLSEKTSESNDSNSVLKELLERKRVLEMMLKEVNDKIAVLSVPSPVHKTTPENEKDEFFGDAGVAGMKYCDSQAIYDIRPDAKFNLIREPDNQYDKNAVAVYDQHSRKVGYLTKQTNIPISHALDDGYKLYAKVVTLPLYEKYPNMKIEIWESK